MYEATPVLGQSRVELTLYLSWFKRLLTLSLIGAQSRLSTQWVGEIVNKVHLSPAEWGGAWQ